jgi:hypothetical protein
LWHGTDFFSHRATVGHLMAFLWHDEGDAMQTFGLPKSTNVTPEDPTHGPLDFELLDLYVAMFIVVPVALFLKSLWS